MPPSPSFRYALTEEVGGGTGDDGDVALGGKVGVGVAVGKIPRGVWLAVGKIPIDVSVGIPVGAGVVGKGAGIDASGNGIASPGVGEISCNSGSGSFWRLQAEKSRSMTPKQQ